MFATDTATGQVQWLDARHRTQAHVEDRNKQLKACGARTLPSIDYDRNAAWLQLAALATSLTAWLRHLALRRPRQSHHQDPAVPAPIRPSPPRHPRQTQDPQNPARLAMAPDLATAWERLQALHPA